MGIQIRVELDSAEIRKFLQTDEGIGSDLQSRADNVAAAAEARMPDPPRVADSHFGTSVRVGFDRQRASVRTVSHEARVAEAQDHVLLSSLDAARSP